MIGFARTFIEMSALWLWAWPRVAALIRKESGAELLDHGAEEGLIVLAPHLGAWELAGLYVAARGRLTSMYRPQRHLDDVILAARQRNGALLVPDDVGGVKRLYRALKRGEMVGILPDQVARTDSGFVFAPFFGVPAVTMLLVPGLARRTGARVVFVVAERLPGGQGFHIRCLAAPPGVDDADDAKAAAALNRGVEACIRLRPEQYQWTYRRFRRRPDGGPSPYSGPSI
jgi:KDO2-lipid IV(A) lauroyltransferase